MKIADDESISRRVRSRKLLAEMKKTFGKKLDTALTGRVAKTIDATPDRLNSMDYITFFGGIHARLRESPEPPGRRAVCAECGVPFKKSDAGYRLRSDFYHKKCFTNALVRSGSVSLKKQDPRRRAEPSRN